MCAALACAAAGVVPGDRAYPARWQLCDRLLPAPFMAALDDRNHHALARFSTRIFRAAASELARDRLVARQPLVRARSLARTARPHWRSARPRGAQSAVSILSMSSSLNPKWWPI